MNKLINNLVLFGKNEESKILNDLAEIIKEIDSREDISPELQYKFGNVVKGLIDLALEFGFEGNLWQCYLTYLLMNDVNSFSLAFEKKRYEKSSLTPFALNDMDIFHKLYNYDFSNLENKMGISYISALKNFKQSDNHYSNFNRTIQELGQGLYECFRSANSDEEFLLELTEFYRNTGVGKLGLYKAFRVIEDSERDAKLLPISNLMNVRLDDIVGYESQKLELLKNTKAFVEGIVSNNVLLYGDSGTGKSTSIRAIANEFYDDGLRLIEIYKHQLKYLSKIISEIKNRNYKFIIYMDDLSFEDFETDYKYLKSLIEGRLEARPTNVLVYATSNRRHLIKETWKDRSDMEIDGEIHKSDNLEEKLSLSSRFGVTIQFLKPLQEGYLNIVRELAKRNGIEMSDEELESEAIKWERSHGGGRTGRTAEQFINYLKIQN